MRSEPFHVNLNSTINSARFSARCPTQLPVFIGQIEFSFVRNDFKKDNKTRREFGMLRLKERRDAL
jgi:hypothetical protein